MQNLNLDSLNLKQKVNYDHLLITKIKLVWFCCFTQLHNFFGINFLFPLLPTRTNKNQACRHIKPVTKARFEQLQTETTKKKQVENSHPQRNQKARLA